LSIWRRLPLQALESRIVGVLSSVWKRLRSVWRRPKRAQGKGGKKTGVVEPELPFESSCALFEEIAGAAGIYGEYGAGKSTIWVHRHTSAEIISVDTNAAWLSMIEDTIGPSDRLLLQYVDVGPVGEWGRPLNYACRDRFETYLDALWTGHSKPDVVLIDGRFRVACFLTCLRNADPGTVILFDDYGDRPYYHIVAELLPPVRLTGRMAVFVVSEERDFTRISGMLDMFRMVMD
jgi:hypothetical protein